MDKVTIYVHKNRYFSLLEPVRLFRKINMWNYELNIWTSNVNK